MCSHLEIDEVSRLMPRMLLDIQNRGQLAAGMTTFNPRRAQLIDTHKDVGTVVEASDRAGLARKVARLVPVVCIKG